MSTRNPKPEIPESTPTAILEVSSGEHLTAREATFVLESLRVTRETFSNYQSYPDETFRAERLAFVDTIIEKVRRMKAQNHRR